MACTNCGFENREGKRFCVECGVPLALRCPSCQAETQPGQKFCGECGSALTAAPAASSPAPNAVRKTVTVLFADLGGSTGFGERTDAEVARQVLARYHALLQETIDAHAGTVAKFMGDGMMATFGIPEVAEDDARRAVAAGAALQQRFAEFAADVERGHGETLTLRVGVNTGEVVIGEGDADVIGDALNVAARLEKACRPGHVLVGEETWRLTRGEFGYDVLGEVTVAGRAQPVAVYELAQESETEPETAAPFVGRDAEMQRLVGVFDDARQAASARLVTVLGSPGVGKTRLSRELCTRAAEATGARTFEIRCDRAGEATFAPVAHLIRHATGLADDADADATRAALGAVFGETETDRTRLVDVLAGLVGAAPTRSVEETFWGVRRLVEAGAADAPLVVVIDDIQWAEPLLLDLIEHLAEWVAGAAVLLVGLARPELREVRASLAEPGRPVAAVVVLDGLDASATEALAAGLLGTERLPAGLAERLPESTDGNPLFVRELVRMLVDDRVIRRRPDGEWELTIDAESVDVPPTIQSLLGARVERLPAAERELLEHASVVGAEFSLGALRELTGNRAPVTSLLESMRRKELVEPTGTYAGDEPVYRFHHVLIRDAAYRRLLKTTRAELHERVAVWTDRTAADLTGEHDAATAFHYEQAYRYRAELGARDEHATALGRRAADLLTTAAQRALGRDDLASAGTLSARALALLPDSDVAARSDLLQMGCECLLASGNGAAAKPLVEELGRSAAGDPRLTAWAGCFAAQLVGLTDPDGLVAADAQAQAAAATLTELGDKSGQAKAHQVRAGLLTRLGRVGDCELELDLALAAARAADDRRRVTAVLGAAPDAALFGPSPVARAGGRCLDVVRLLRITTASPSVEAASNRCQAVLESLRGRFDVSRSMLASAREAMEELGLRHGLAQTDLYAGMVELIAGDPHAAIPPLRAAFGGLGALGVGADAGMAAALLARALLVDGNVDEADEMATASEQLAGQNLKTAIGWRVARAEVLAERGDVAGAVAIAEQAVDIAAGTDLVIDHADACAALTALRARAGDAAGARAARADARRLYEQKGATVPAERLAENEAPAATTHPVPSLPRSVRDDNEERHDHPRAENRASRVLARYEQLVSERRYDEAAALYADDLVATDRRSGVSVPPLGPVELQQGVRLTFDLFDGFDSVNVAVRGERLVLSKLALRTHDGLEVPFLQLFEIDDSDRIRATTHFDPDALADAIDELDERYLAGEGAEHADAIRPMLEHLAAFHARDWEALAQSVRDYEIVDHRGLWPDTGPEAYVERMQSLAATAPDVTIVARQLHLRGDAGLITAVVRATAAQGDRYEYTFHTVSRPGRMEYFDEEDFAAALARFDELSRTDPSPPRVENAASRIWAQVIAAVNSGASLDDLAELYAPFHLDDRRPVVNFGERDSAGVGRALDVFREQGYEFEVPTALAVRGERLALCASRSRTSGGYESAQLDVVEVDEQGRLLDCVQFGEADLDAAIDELDTRYLAGEGAEHSDVVRAAGRVQHAFNEEPDALDALCSPDFMLDDHRRLMYGEGDRDYFVSIRRASSDAHVRATATINRSIFVQGRALLAVQDLHRDDADGADYRWGYSVLVAFDALWRLQRLEWFDDDHWDAALARFDELAAEVPEPAAAKPDSYALLTRAVRCAHAYDEAFAAQDWDRIEASYHDDVVNEDRRNAVSSGVTTGRDGLLELVRRLVDVGFTTVTQTPVAVRGEALALVHRTWETASGYCLELLAVIEYDEEDRMTANVMFDLDGHGAALQGLDDRYCAGEGAADAYLIRRAGDFVRSLASPDGAATLALVHPDVRFTDHRRLGLGTLGFDGVRGILAARAEQIAADTSYFRDLAVRDSTTMGLLVSAGTGPDGTEVLYELYWVSRWVAGRTLDVDGYDPPDHDAARARFDQLAATDPRTPHIHNAALQVFARADWLLGHGEAAAGYALMADDVVGTFRRRAVSSPPTSGREEFERVIRSMRETFPRATYEPVAVRGDRLALVRINMLTDAGFEVPHLGLYEIDEAELISRVVTFDDSDLVGALEELEQRHRELSGDTYTHAEQSFAERSIAYQRGDLDTMLTFLSQHYQVVDHTPVGFGTADAAGLRAQIAAWDPQVPTVVIQAKRYVSERAILEAIAHRGTTDDGSDYVWENATVACFDANGLVVADHSFPIEQWDEAVALFDELATLEP